MLEKLEKGEKYNPENYIMETGFVFAPREIYSTEYQNKGLESMQEWFILGFY